MLLVDFSENYGLILKMTGIDFIECLLKITGGVKHMNTEYSQNE